MSGAAFRLLAVSGSLRYESVSTQLLLACAEIAPHGVRISLHDGLDNLPYFLAAGDELDVPAAVALWRARVAACDGLIVSSPEHAGMPGVLKNALDWLVSGDDIIDKPV